MTRRPFFLRRGLIFLALAVLTSAAFGADYTGTVLSPDGKPVKGATVYFVGLVDPSLVSPSIRLDLPTARTDDNGGFHFPRPVFSGAEFIAAADGFGLSSVQPIGAGPVQIRLRPRTDVSLTFLTADNKPAPNLNVSVRRLYLPIRMSEGANNNSLWIPLGYRSPFRATTDANGVCIIPGLPQAARATFSVEDDRYADLSYDDIVQLSTSDKTSAKPIHLQVAANISGRVLYELTKQPAAGIAVKSISSDSDNEQTVTGADGSYIFKRLRPGQYTICVDPDSGMQTSWTASSNATVAIAAGESKTGVDFTLIPGVVLSGKVLAADDSKPIADVPLGIYSPSHPRNSRQSQLVSTDANGSFSVRVPPGALNIYIASETPANGFGRPINDEKDVTIAAGGTMSVEFRLPRALVSALKGKVVDPDGKPVSGASVFMFTEQPSLLSNRTGIITNADGIFQTLPFQRNGKVDIRAKFQDLATPKALVVYSSSTGDIVVQLQKNAFAAVTGRVVDQDGKPLKDARIEMIYPVGRNLFGDEAATTDDQGNYKVDSLWADMAYQVEAEHDGYGYAETKGDLHIGPGQSTSVPDLMIYKRDSTVAGVLLDRENKPVSGQRVFVRGPRSGYSNLTTDSSGKFRCAVVTGDSLTIFYNFNTNRMKQQTAKAGDLNIVLHTAPPVVIRKSAPPPVPIVVAAPPVAAQAPAPPPAPIVYDPADAVTWTGWFWAVVLVLGGGVITVVVNAIAAIRGRGQAT